LFAYIGSAFFAKPDAIQVLKATFIPTLSFDATFLATLVAILAHHLALSLLLQADQEVEEEISLAA